jgi:hypothetical protein
MTKTITLPRSLVEYILRGPAGDRRQLRDSTILVELLYEVAVAGASCRWWRMVGSRL